MEETTPQTPPVSPADTAEPTVPPTDASNLEAETAAPQDPLAAAQAECLLWKDTALRARADLDNFRKRMTQEKTDAIKYANGSLLEDLLPILDNFQFGLQAAQADPAAQNILIGLNMVAGQLQNFLRDQSVEEIASVGQPFDPNVHEAVSQQPSAEVAENHVISVIRRGFRLKDRLLRPATVVVSQGAAS